MEVLGCPVTSSKSIHFRLRSNPLGNIFMTHLRDFLACSFDWLAAGEYKWLCSEPGKCALHCWRSSGGSLRIRHHWGPWAVCRFRPWIGREAWELGCPPAGSLTLQSNEPWSWWDFELRWLNLKHEKTWKDRTSAFSKGGVRVSKSLPLPLGRLSLLTFCEVPDSLCELNWAWLGYNLVWHPWNNVLVQRALLKTQLAYLGWGGRNLLSKRGNCSYRKETLTIRMFPCTNRWKSWKPRGFLLTSASFQFCLCTETGHFTTFCGLNLDSDTCTLDKTGVE